MAEEAGEPVTKKRKADELDESKENNDDNAKSSIDKGKEDDPVDDDEITCNICFEPWSNTGAHRISSLKCGHFFGLSCIEKWLNSTGGSDCPSCNEKATKRDIRHHYVARLKAVDTGDRDRALEQLEALRKDYRKLDLEHATIKVNNHLLLQENEKLKNEVKVLRSSNGSLAAFSASAVDVPSAACSSSSSTGKQFERLVYIKRLEILKPPSSNESADNNKVCRVMAFNWTFGMLVVSQPSFTALAPGFGVRRVQMLDMKLDSFVGIHKEPIRDLAFNPVRQDQLLSVAQDKTVKLTNISSCAEIQKFQVEHEPWSCCWHGDDPNAFFVGTKRGEVLLFDIRHVATFKAQLQFPVEERRPIIRLAFVPKAANHPTFPCSGLLVMTLASLWFFQEQRGDNGEIVYKPHKLNLAEPFWSMTFEASTRTLMVSTRPSPHARHLVCELSRINVANAGSGSESGSDFQVVLNIVSDDKRGGSFKGRAFLRSTLCCKPESESGQLLALYGRGSSHGDHKLVIKEVGSDRTVQEVISSGKPIVDICALKLNSDHLVCVLTETDVVIYKWN